MSIVLNRRADLTLEALKRVAWRGEAVQLSADARANIARAREDFLKLIVTQLTTQDPLNPQKDTEFIAQMAQFTTLEQSKTMQTDIAGLRSDQQLLRANALLGRVVALQESDGRLTRGTVSAIHMESGTPQIMVNDQPYEVSDVVSIEAAGPK